MSNKIGFPKEKLTEWLQQSRRGREIEDVEDCKPFELEVAIQLIQTETKRLMNRLSVTETRKGADERHGKRTHGHNADIKSFEKEIEDLNILREIVSKALIQKTDDRVKI